TLAGCRASVTVMMSIVCSRSGRCCILLIAAKTGPVQFLFQRRHTLPMDAVAVPLPPPLPRSHRRRMVLAIAVAVAAGLGVCWYVYLRATAPPTPPDPAPASVEPAVA